MVVARYAFDAFTDPVLEMGITVSQEGNPMHLLLCHTGSLKGAEFAQKLQTELNALPLLLPLIIDLEGRELGQEAFAKLFFFSQKYHSIHGRLSVVNVPTSTYEALERLGALSMDMIEFKKCNSYFC